MSRTSSISTADRAPGGAEASGSRGPLRPLLLHDRRSARSANRARLVDEARQRRLKLVELRSAEQLAEADRAISRHCPSALGLAGGDETQSAVAAVASGHELPYSCIPAGIHNLFARDLGLDPDDMLGGLDAFGKYCEYDVDLAEVNGLTFVNYVALGLDCLPKRRTRRGDDEVQSPTSLVSYVVSRRARAPRLRWLGPSGEHTGTAFFVSNNRYRFQSLEIGGRTRLDGGVLGIGILGSVSSADTREVCWHELSASCFELDATEPIHADADGRIVTLDPPIRFRSLPRALLVRLPLPS